MHLDTDDRLEMEQDPRAVFLAEFTAFRTLQVKSRTDWRTVIVPRFEAVMASLGFRLTAEQRKEMTERAMKVYELQVMHEATRACAVTNVLDLMVQWGYAIQQESTSSPLAERDPIGLIMETAAEIQGDLLVHRGIQITLEDVLDQLKPLFEGKRLGFPEMTDAMADARRQLRRTLLLSA
jgi:hypothetical protein